MSNEHKKQTINLEIIYVQCNEQMRDQYHKRDQLLVFYGAVMGIIIANINLISQLNHIELFYLFFIGISFLLSHVFINYMKWNYMYKNSAITLQNLMSVNHLDLNQNIVNQIYQIVAKEEHCDIKSYLHKTETKIFNVFLLFSALNFFIYAYLLHPIISQVVEDALVNTITSLAAISYIIYFNCKSYIISQKVSRLHDKYNPNYMPWIINLYKQKEQIESLVHKHSSDEVFTKEVKVV